MLGQWLNGNVLHVNNGGRVLIHWAGFTRYFEAWLNALEVRKPEGERPLDRRRVKIKFFKTTTPKASAEGWPFLCVPQPRLVSGKNNGKKRLLQRRGEFFKILFFVG